MAGRERQNVDNVPNSRLAGNLFTDYRRASDGNVAFEDTAELSACLVRLRIRRVLIWLD